MAYLFLVRRMRAVRTLSILLGTLSGIVGVVFSIMALILVTAVAGYHLVLLHWAGVFLLVVVAAHLLPLTLIKRRAGLALYAAGVVAAAALFGDLYYFATIDDPFRSEDELFEDVPRWLAGFLCLLPLAVYSVAAATGSYSYLSSASCGNWSLDNLINAISVEEEQICGDTCAMHLFSWFRRLTQTPVQHSSTSCIRVDGRGDSSNRPDD